MAIAGTGRSSVSRDATLVELQPDLDSLAQDNKDVGVRGTPASYRSPFPPQPCNGPEMTQRTLVGTPTQMSRPSHDKECTGASWRRDTMERPPSSRETVDAVREAVPSSAPANDVTVTSAHADQASKRGKTRRERPGTERGVSSRLHHGEDAPFRNTCARSKSVEPPPVTKVSTRGDIARDNGRKAAQREVRSGEKEGSWMVYLRSTIREMSTREQTQYHLRDWSQTCSWIRNWHQDRDRHRRVNLPPLLFASRTTTKE
ncbi:hypothetical protein SCLCIDRAFT_11448 [Scleroderma citrinum Foug A]|uniref:Uncharacterized protein n=1 Tax=Scleroderma citrinum Foug A TaxID=1036808 RepID=A0A0C2ZMY6_9AGAM|nr:hypothetical protein SCLCIDRAFT_11448 [Scleroderma citrinum Foug A]